MPSDDSVYVGHMLDMAQKAIRLAEGKDRAEFDRDEALQLALAHIIQIIGGPPAGCHRNSVTPILRSRGEP